MYFLLSRDALCYEMRMDARFLILNGGCSEYPALLSFFFERQVLLFVFVSLSFCSSQTKMSWKIYTYPNNPRVWKALIAGKYAGVEIETPAFEMGKDNKTPEFLGKFPVGKVRFLFCKHI